MALRVIVAGAGARGLDWMREVKSSSLFELAATVDTDEDALRQAASHHTLATARCFHKLEDALRT
ncbi:MAG: hypothetical protein LC731_00635, partial [Acidobacteria bacterium]|nr:hypothetical protein [Acidobacteriota bacterium]